MGSRVEVSESGVAGRKVEVLAMREELVIYLNHFQNNELCGELQGTVRVKSFSSRFSQAEERGASEALTDSIESPDCLSFFVSFRRFSLSVRSPSESSERKVKFAYERFCLGNSISVEVRSSRKVSSRLNLVEAQECYKLRRYTLSARLPSNHRVARLAAKQPPAKQPPSCAASANWPRHRRYTLLLVGRCTDALYVIVCRGVRQPRPLALSRNPSSSQNRSS
ncbi:hypothetical protein BHE74_00006553 [Ensete ventricosum]|nr:hypothetical protein GW17_00017487 [Ensete ventricosum]RWW84820.1 hypothetical protein BHE74_00006553 [Ensete ventricosum]